MVDLTAMRVTIRYPKSPRIFVAVYEVRNQEASFVVSAQIVVLGHFERKVVRAKIITQQRDEFHFRDVLVHRHNSNTESPIVLEGTVTSVGERGVVFLAFRNQTAKERVGVEEETVVGETVLTKFVLKTILKLQSFQLKLSTKCMGK